MIHVKKKVPLYIYLTAGLFYNGTTGQLPCFNTTEEFIECADPTGCGTGPAALAWDYQVHNMIIIIIIICQELCYVKNYVGVICVINLISLIPRLLPCMAWPLGFQNMNTVFVILGQSESDLGDP